MHLTEILALLGAALLTAKLIGGYLNRFGIPSVLTELVIGIILGNLGGAVGTAFQSVESAEIVKGLSELGVLLLLFVVGLETNLSEIGRVGKDAGLAAVAGVITPFGLAFTALPIWSSLSGETAPSFQHTLFMAAALTATSVGITARVLQEAGKLKSVSGQIILGAAVIDDVLGVIILTLVSAIVVQGQISAVGVLELLAKITIFGAGFALIRRFAVHPTLARIRPLETSGTITILLVSLCLISAWIAEAAGLAGIIGAFTLGIVLDDVQFKGYRELETIRLEHLIKPVTDFLSPIFFIVMGMSVKLSAIANPDALGLAGVLIVVAILGKLACGIPISRKAREQGADRLLIGFGMIPRGEVGLIFAAMGLRLNVLNQADYAAVVAMVAVTTLLAPILITWQSKKTPG